MSARSFAEGLVALNAVATRRRLAEALTEARSKITGPGGAALAEEIRHVESALLLAAHWAIRSIDAALITARAAPAQPETIEEAHGAVVAGLASDAPLRPNVSARNLAVSRTGTLPPGC